MHFKDVDIDRISSNLDGYIGSYLEEETGLTKNAYDYAFIVYTVHAPSGVCVAHSQVTDHIQLKKAKQKAEERIKGLKQYFVCVIPNPLFGTDYYGDDYSKFISRGGVVNAN